MKKWLTLIGYCLSNFSNALIFGLYSDNISSFATFYNTSKSSIENLFYVGLLIEIFFCLPAIRLIQWRLDYSIIASGYLTACSSLLCSFSYGNLIIVYASLIINSIAQLFILPTCFYVAELWFPLQERSFAIGIGFYSNLLGYGVGAIMTSLLVTSEQNVRLQMIIITIINWLAFIGTISLVRNRPKVSNEVMISVKWENSKVLWKKKYLAYNSITLSVFLGVSWAFLATCMLHNYSVYTLEKFISTEDIAFLIMIWITSGVGFGIFMSFFMQKKLKETGNFIFYDRVGKAILILGLIGYLVMGILVTVQWQSFYLVNMTEIQYAILMVFIGIGSIGFYGIAFLSLIESLYPIPTLLISTIVVAFASLYSLLSLSLSQIIPEINQYFSLSIVTFLPLVYIMLTYETNLKRYKYYLNEKQSKFQLLKIIEEDEAELQDTISERTASKFP